MSKLINSRKVNHACNGLFPERWSPRAMSGEPVSGAELNALFEAARWAPSCMNSQPWRFLYAKRDTPAWDAFFGLLVDGNKVWCANAAVLIVIAAENTVGTGCAAAVGLDAGAAWENLALQASLSGLVCHGMAGFDYGAAKTVLNLPDSYQVLAMAAVGRPGSIEALPEKLREREQPGDRRPVEEFVFEGRFG